MYLRLYSGQVCIKRFVTSKARRRSLLPQRIRGCIHTGSPRQYSYKQKKQDYKSNQRHHDGEAEMKQAA